MSPLHLFTLSPGISHCSFSAMIFYETDSDIKKCQQNGVTKKIIDFVYTELERAGRGKRDEITVNFEIDSDENVINKYGGDYYRRMNTY